MASGVVRTTFKVKGEAAVWLKRPEFVEQGSGVIAELAVTCEGTEVSSTLIREEVENLVSEAHALLESVPSKTGEPVSRLKDESLHEAVLCYIRACDEQAKGGKNAIECQNAFLRLRSLALVNRREVGSPV